MSASTLDLSGWIELSSPRFGSRTLACSDDFFAPMENLLKPEEPVFLPDKYTDRGKWMDGWESRRRRGSGHDWCVLRLGVPGVIRRVVVDTAHFTGNHPESASLEGCFLSEGSEEVPGDKADWKTVLPRSPLQGNSRNVFAFESGQAFSHLRLNIFPDGGVARLRIYGEAFPDWDRLASSGGMVDLASAAIGGRVLFASDMHFGSRHNLIMPDRAPDMRDGWETRRRRGPGYDWCVIRLAAEGAIHRIEVDTAHFKGNYPDSCSVDSCLAAEELTPESMKAADWQNTLPRIKLQADKRHFFQEQLRSPGAVNHARLNIHPDGGVSRLRLFGEFTENGWRQIGLRFLNGLSAENAQARLLPCCACRRWASRLADARPFVEWPHLLSASDAVWSGLTADDCLEAFAGHPRIGERKAAPGQDSRSAAWSQSEQAGATRAAPDIQAQLAEANRVYEERFGFIFIVCASGKTAEEILALLQARMKNDREAEIAVAAEEQRKITRLRLERMFVP